MGSMRNGSGDDFFVLFNTSGAFIKGLDHERLDRSASGLALYQDVPVCFASGVNEPAFSPDKMTFCYWRTFDDHEWHAARAPISGDDGSEWMLSELDGNPASYISFAKDYYEVVPDSASVASIYQHAPMTLALASSLNRNIDYDAFAKDLVEIAYPIA